MRIMSTSSLPNAGGQPSKSIYSRAASLVASKPKIVLGIIVVLTMLVIATVVYYRGVLMFGPFYTPLSGGGGQVLGSGSGSAMAPPSTGDAETERLIDAINGTP